MLSKAVPNEFKNQKYLHQCFLEQLAFYSLHNKNEKYMKRAKKAWEFIPVALQTNIIQQYKKMNYNGHKPIEDFINKDYQQ